ELKSRAFSEFTDEDGVGKESYDAYSSHGTIKFSGMASELGILPTRYWESGSFEEAEKLSSYHWEDDISDNNGCHRCPCRCGQVYRDIVDIEYETSFALGSNLALGDIEEVAKANQLCDDLGMDTLSAGNSLGFLMRLSEEGEIDEDIEFGDAGKVKELIRKIAYREGLGDVVAEGVKRIGEEFDREDIAVHVNGMSPPAYDPRALKGMGLGFYTSTRGACHLRSDCDGIELGGGKTTDEKGRWSTIEKDRKAVDGKEYVAWRENYVTLHDTLGSCKLTGRDVYSPELMSEFIEAHLGIDMTAEEVYRTGERIYNLERLYGLNQDPGLKKRIHVPEQFSSPSPVEDLGGAKLTKEQVEKMLSDYYKERGWDKDGTPTEEKLEELDIDI
ncbi:MAG: aldehyde ferredoxin oxidoreductase C-terminal domain-containing protein, partial [Candidatus Thermoplasmatota archaeon]